MDDCKHSGDYRMSFTYRENQNTPMTWPQLDGNFRAVEKVQVEVSNQALAASASAETANQASASAILSSGQAEDYASLAEEMARISVVRWCGNHEEAPSTRLDGSPLQISDEYGNLTDELRYNWTGTSWVALNSSAQYLEQRLSSSEGAGIVVFDPSAIYPSNSIGRSLQDLPEVVVDAADRAEAAADLALALSGIYADTAEGLLATDPGQVFGVPVANDLSSVILYANVAGSAVDTGARLPSTEIFSYLVKDSGEPLDEAHDLDGNIYRRTRADGGLELPGLSMSVQEEIHAIPARNGSPANANDLINIEDAAGNLILRQSVDGGLFIPGIAGPVQAYIGGEIGEVTWPVRTARSKMGASIAPYFADLAANKIRFAPPPALLIPNGMHVPNSIVSAFTVTTPPRTNLDTPYTEDGSVVHPYLIEMPTAFRGYRYILGQTPYDDGRLENPIIYGSQDLVNFTLLPDIAQPLDNPDSGNKYNHLSDDAFTYDPINGDLIFVWRQNLFVPGETTVVTNIQIWYSRTKDGYKWSPRRLVIDLPDDGLASPAILFNPVDAKWHMWSVGGEGIVTHRTASEIDGAWTVVSVKDFTVLYGVRAWHLEVKYMGNKFVMLLNQRIPGSNLFFGISDDGETWEFGGPLIAPELDGTYKGTFLPEFSGNTLTMIIAWSTNITINPNDSTRFFITRSNTITL